MKKWLCLALALCLLPLTALGAELTEFTVRERLSLSLADGVTYRQWDLTPKTRSASWRLWRIFQDWRDALSTKY